MSSRPRLATLATERLNAAIGALPARAPAPAAEARIIEAMAVAIATNARRRRLRRTGIVVASGVVAAAGILLALRSRAPAPSTTTPAAASITVEGHGTGTELVHEDHTGGFVRGALVAGDRLRVGPHGHASLAVSTGTRIGLDPESELSVRELDADQRWFLLAGSLDASVAKLGPGHRFVVQTPDAEVEVRGTSFRVTSSTTACRGVRTRVFVTEGVVVVRAGGEETRVGAGSRWPLDCEAVAVAESPSVPSSSVVPKVVETPVSPIAKAIVTPVTPAARTERGKANDEGRPDPASEPVHPDPSLRASELAEQNRAYAEGAAARRRGDTLEAIAAYERFLHRYPASQLSESATVERMRLLANLDPTKGASSARDYLARWPLGFARNEATAIANRSP